jgi:flavodoxin
VGNTKLIAEHIQKRTGGDLFEIEAEKSYNMPYNQLVNIAKEEAEKNEKPAFKGGIKNINQYDTIFIGGSIWWELIRK